MATCQHCGSEITGQYCDLCGARAPEERSKKVRKPAPASSKGRNAGPLAPNRIMRTTAIAIFGILLLVGAALTGFYMSAPPAAGTAGTDGPVILEPDSLGLSAVAQAEQYMEQGVEQMKNGDRAGAVALFRKSVSQFESVLKAEPDNLYARSYLGLVYYYAGDSKNALANEQAVLEKDPDYLWALFNTAWMYETGGKKEEALQYYQHYLNVVETEQQNVLKYAEQPELIPRQIEAATAAIEKLKGSAGQ